MAGKYDHYCAGVLDHHGEKIAHVIASSTFVVTYMVEGDSLKFDVDSEKPTPRQCSIIREYERIHSLIKRSFKPKDAFQAKRDLAAALFNAFSETDETTAISEYFEEVEKETMSLTSDRARFTYLFSGLISAIIILTVTYIIYLKGIPFPTWPKLITGTTAGIIGASISLCVTAHNWNPNPDRHIIFIGLEGISRTILGGLFGFVLVCCVRAQILLGILSENPYGLVAFAMLAGFSETFVLEIFQRMQSESKNSHSQN